MAKLKKVGPVVMDVLEIYVPSVCVITLFTSFILQIFSRYALRAPLVWPYEVAQISYVFIIMLGTCYAERHQENICFSVLYDAMCPSLKKICDMLSSAIIVAVFVYSLYSLIGFYQFFMTRNSVVLRVPLGVVYFPYVPFVLITICRSARRFVHALRTPAAVLSAEHAANISEEAIHEQ